MQQAGQAGGAEGEGGIAAQAVGQGEVSLAVHPFVRHLEVAEQVLKRGAAFEPNVLSDVDFPEICGWEGKGASAQVAILLHKGHGMAGPGQGQRRPDA